MRFYLVAVVYMLGLSELVSANDVTPKTIDTVVVSGAMPAPSPWKATKGNKTLWIMGTLSPSPLGMDWMPGKALSKLKTSSAFISSPALIVNADVGIFKGLMMYSSYRKTRLNPDGKTLSEILPADVYSRWSRLSKLYIGQDADDELRPMYAAEVLFNAALKRNQMTRENAVNDELYKQAKDLNIPIMSSTISLSIKDPKNTLKQLNAATLNDVPCLVQTMDRLDSDLSIMAVRANAWAKGDIQGLLAMPYIDQKKACADAISSNVVAKENGISDVSSMIQNNWLSVVNKTFETHITVFSVLPVERLLDGGLVKTLEAQGYVLTAPE